MYKQILKAFIFLLPSVSLAQYSLDYGLGFAFTNYLGEIGGKDKSARGFVLDLRNPHIRVGGSAFGRYKLNPLISFKASLNWTMITGSDKNSTYAPRRARNLSFKNTIQELDLTAELFFFEIPTLYQSIKHNLEFRSYVFSGVGVFHHNPKALYQGTWYALQPLETEGVRYKLIGVSIPMGFGGYFTLDRKYRLGIEVGYRKTFTDYLDDVSDRYVDPTTQSTLAAALANRTAELISTDPEVIKLQSYNYGFLPGHEEGALRGNVKNKDAIITTEVHFSYVLRGKSSFYRSRYPGLFGNKHKKRRIRAKF